METKDHKERKESQEHVMLRSGAGLILHANNALTCSARTKYIISSRLKIFRETLLFEGFFLLKSNKVIDS